MPEDEQPQPEAPAEDEAGVEVNDLGKSRARGVLLKQCVFIFLISCLCSAYLQVNPGYMPYGREKGEAVWSWNRNEGLPQGDGYYHIKMAYLYRTGKIFEAGKDFHWTRVSIWNGHFSDKDFLYHIYLIPFTLMAQDEFHWQAFVNGAKMATIVANGLFMLALFGTLLQLKVRKAWFWTLASGALMGTLLCLRLTEPRSWVFGVCLAMLGWGALSRGSKKWAFIIAVVYVLAYTGSQLLLAMAFYRMAFRFIMGPEKGTRKAALKQDLLLAGVVFAGLVVGWALHPESFALLRIWWVQNILVPYVHSGGAPTGLIRSISAWLLDWPPNAAMPQVPPSLLGSELTTPLMRDLLPMNVYEFTAPMLIPCLSAWFRVRPSKPTVATFIIGVGFVLLHIYNGRFVEYAVPFLLLAGSMWVSEIVAARNVRRLLPRLKLPPRRLFQGAVGLMLILLAVNLYRTAWIVGFRPKAHLQEVGEWMQAHPELKGKVIYNHNWDTFPELLMFRSDCDYIWGMDPVFTAVRADKQARRVVGFMQNDMREWGEDPADAVRVLRDDFHANYIFINDRSDGQKLYEQMKDWARKGLIVPEELHVEYGFAIYRIPPKKRD